MMASEQLQIIKTEDGSCTLYNASLDETYHSTHGAMEESLHVYIRNGLLKLSKKSRINILEIGFGTGLNALLTLDHIRPDQPVNYYALEPFPPHKDIIKQYYDGFAVKPSSLPELERLLEIPANKVHPLSSNFNFCLLNTTLQLLKLSDVRDQQFDLVYYDAFGPSKQPDMWTLETLKNATDLMAAGGLLCTYCAQGQFKRHLKTLGLLVENPPGALGKREMTVARKVNNEW